MITKVGQAIKVYNTDPRQYAVPNHPDIVSCNIPDIIRNKHFLKRRCTYSDYLQTWLFNDSIVEVYTKADKSEKVLDHKKRENRNFAKVGDDYFAIHLVEKNPTTGLYQLV